MLNSHSFKDSPTIAIIAGEVSGDILGAGLIHALKARYPQAKFIGIGGERMIAEGFETLFDMEELSVMGLVEVLKHLPRLLKIRRSIIEQLSALKPDVFIGIDAPDFNLDVELKLKQRGIKTIHYVSPSVWAWRQKRVYKIAAATNLVLAFLPFEKAFYEQKHQYPVHFVGHPLLDAIAQREEVDAETFKSENGLDSRPIIALLPGSRKQEIAKMLKIMLSVVDDYHQYQFVIAGAPSIDYEFYQQFIKEENVHFVSGKTYDLLSVSYAALVTSGTATLETALLNVPEVVCYKGSWLSYHIAKRIIKLKYISLVNLIMDKPVVTELIQGDLTKKNLEKELDKLSTYTRRYEIFKDYVLLREKLGGEGASEKTAALIVKK